VQQLLCCKKNLFAKCVNFKKKIAYTYSLVCDVKVKKGVGMAYMDVVILLAVVLSLAYMCVAAWIWTVVIAATLILLCIFGKLGALFLTICWIIFLAAALFANLKQLRQQYVVKPQINRLKKIIPGMSKTERAAIDAGDVWWEKDLFCGLPKWKKLLAVPKPTLTAEEQSFIDNEVETLCAMLDDWKILTQEHDMPQPVWEYLRKERFFGMVIPKDYGGRGFSALAHSTVVVKIATRSISAAVNTMVPNSLGPGELLLHYGTDEQKNYYLPRLASGQEIPCFALTSPEAGSDAGSMIDTGIVCHGEHDGKQVLGIRLTWDKRYITLAPVATVLGLAFRLYDPEHLLGQEDEVGITCGLLPTSHPGVEIGHRHSPMHLVFMNGPTRGTDVFIPLDWIIGGAKMAGKGWQMLMECLSIGRALSLPALGTACAKLSYRTTGAYAHVRKQFNTSISNFDSVQEALGAIAGYTYILESCRIMTAGAIDLKLNPSIVSAIAKYHMTELGRKVMNHAMDIHGGHAIQVGPRNFLAHPYMALPVSITVEGANILTRALIIFGQGAIRCHPYALRELELISNYQDSDLAELDTTLMSHIGFVISNVVRNLCIGLTGGLLLWAPVRGRTARLYRQLSRMSTGLALLADVCMISMGGELKRKERISARLGDILSELYLASTVLKYFKDNGQPDSDLDYVQWSVENCLYNIQIAFDELSDNMPNRFLAKLVYAIIFPFGPAYRKPSDALTQKLVAAMGVPSEFRDRLTKYLYISPDSDDPIRELENAFNQRLDLEPLMKRINQAVRERVIPNHESFAKQVQAALRAGILTQDESKSLLTYDVLQQQVIKVDEFSFDLGTVLTE
jgi:acyl-CoA dehydrogenase